MKRFVTILLTLALLLPTLACAETALELEGTIEAARTVTLLAPYSGVIAGVDVKSGDALGEGDALLTIGTTKVYADFDGTVTGLFAEAGDSAASVLDRYGALCYVERPALYTADCTVSGAGSDNENKIVHVGEHVYIRSTENNDRKGEGIVTGAQGRGYTIEVTKPGNLTYNDRIRVYRDNGYKSDDCIGSGAISRVDPVPVTAEGTVLAVHVQDGQLVWRGDLLFETAPDAPGGFASGDGSVAMPEDGTVLSVLAESGAQAAKDAPLLTYCPKGAIELVCAADEDDLSSIRLGDELRVTLDAYPDETIRGTVTAIAGAGNRDGGRVTFDVTITLAENDFARIGMSATAEK